MTLDSVCEYRLYSSLDAERREDACKYLSSFLGNPDPQSEFAQALGAKRHLFKIPLLGSRITKSLVNIGLSRGYNLVLFHANSFIFGHTAFQIHSDKSLHIFSIYVDERLRGYGHGTSLVKSALTHARNTGLNSVRVGNGGSTETNKIYERLCGQSDELSVVPRQGYWLDIQR